ncbi:UNVERIFIED_CONTAM: Inactive exonuclease DIS3L2 [Sesamum radiatum]|uniref:Protein SUPPRESSOR OF VARICOSE n=1 Tax=Sesamum radiatum TaxID=300843 RepID=A0AAW2SGY8_SESRA
MGVLIVESSRGSTHTEEIFVENDFKDNKKKKRRSRKSKQTSSACSSVSEVCMDASILLGDNTSSHHVVPNGHHPSPKVSRDVMTNGHHQLPKEYDAAVSEEPVGPVLIARPVDCYPRRKCYPAHWSAEAVNKALEKGELLRALFHVNAHNRLEAYCKIDGVQTDVLISGLVAQNRAIEGDTVAIVIDSPSLWPRMKGSNETVNNSASHSNYHEASTHVQDCSRGKSKLDLDCEYVISSDNMEFPENGAHHNDEASCGAMSDNSCVNGMLDNGCQPSISDYASPFSGDAYDSMSSLEKLCALITLYPSKRPTGRVVAVVGRSPRRDNVVGFLSVKQWIYSRESKKKNSRKNKHNSDHGYILLTPTDPKFTKMMVPVRKLPASIKTIGSW